MQLLKVFAKWMNVERRQIVRIYIYYFAKVYKTESLKYHTWPLEVYMLVPSWWKLEQNVQRASMDS